MSTRLERRQGSRALHARFEQVADASPGRVAVVAGSDLLTYGELNERANRVAWRLRDLGVERETLVGLSVDRSTDMVVGLLAIIKAGGAYIPLDPGHPQERMSFVLGDSEAPVVVTQRHLIPRLPGGSRELLPLDDTDALAPYGVVNPPQERTSTQEAAYVTYTSGSTGVPKGVVTTHDNVANLVLDQDYLTITPEDRIAALASLSFDASTFEIWGALLNGASSRIYPVPGSSSLSELFEKVRRDAISILALTSSVFRVLEQRHFALAGEVRAILFGGDSVRTDVVTRAEEMFPGDLIHVYGPTETTSFATLFRARTAVDSPLFPLGHPIRGVTVRVIGPDGEPAAPGDEGELYIGGRGVARGYLNRPELTHDRFVVDASGASGSRLYRTGDLVRVGQRGELHFCGRLDRQLKIRGHRIEPAEIESALVRHPGVSDAVVVGRPDGAGDKRLHAYVVRARPETADTADPAGGPESVPDHQLTADIRRYVGRVLPRQQHPATVSIIDSIPVTANLKLDEARLPEPHESVRAYDGDPAGPSKQYEAELIGLWRSKLDVSAIGVDDDFFELGGDSMLALQMAESAERMMGVRIGIAAVLRYPTIRKLADALAKGDVS